MSVWYSIGDQPLPGLHYDDEGERDARPRLAVGVAASWYPYARLAIRADDDNPADEATILLGPIELRELSVRLLHAAEVCERELAAPD